MKTNNRLLIPVFTLTTAILLAGCKGALSDEHLQELYGSRNAEPVIEEIIEPVEIIDEVEIEDISDEIVDEDLLLVEEAAEALPEEVEAEPDYVVIGSEDASLNVEFTNLTNTVISNIQLRANGQWDFEAGLMDDEYILCRQTAVLAFTPSTEESLPYDLRLTMSDGKTYTLHDIDFTEWDNGSILITDGTCYTEYTSNVTNELISTYDYEVSVAQSYVPAAAPDSGCIGSTGLTY
ncbi:MAG: hypothetical protein MJ094_00795 [Saccharofermentans sp.]|nr:hypothetical protein [Saccharofermentans sp.]